MSSWIANNLSMAFAKLYHNRCICGDNECFACFQTVNKITKTKTKQKKIQTEIIS